MINETTASGARRDPGDAAGGPRRVVGLERHYHCSACGCDRHSWTKMPACPQCGEAYVAAVIRRAAFS